MANIPHPSPRRWGRALCATLVSSLTLLALTACGRAWDPTSTLAELEAGAEARGLGGHISYSHEWDFPPRRILRARVDWADATPQDVHATAELLAAQAEVVAGLALTRYAPVAQFTVDGTGVLLSGEKSLPYAGDLLLLVNPAVRRAAVSTGAELTVYLADCPGAPAHCRELLDAVLAPAIDALGPRLTSSLATSRRENARFAFENLPPMTGDRPVSLQLLVGEEGFDHESLRGWLAQLDQLARAAAPMEVALLDHRQGVARLVLSAPEDGSAGDVDAEGVLRAVAVARGIGVAERGAVTVRFADGWYGDAQLAGCSPPGPDVQEDARLAWLRDLIEECPEEG